MASWNVQGMQVLANPPDGSQMHGIAIIYTEWNSLVVDALVNGCVDSLKVANVPENKIYVRKVPSAFELPFAASQMTSKYLEAIICIGAVIEDSHKHNDNIGESVANAIMRLSSTRIMTPVIYGVLSFATKDDALLGAGLPSSTGGEAGKHNFGIDLGNSAVKMLRYKMGWDY